VPMRPTGSVTGLTRRTHSPAMTEGQIVASGKPEVFVALNELDLRELAANQLRTAIIRGVVHTTSKLNPRTYSKMLAKQGHR
jgi:hypothetical protein